jgi:neutral ceramidase
LTVEKKLVNGNFKVIANDADWATKFNWKPIHKDTKVTDEAQASTVTLTWDIPTNNSTGIYRLCYHGDSKTVADQQPTSFTGCSSEFLVTA